MRRKANELIHCHISIAFDTKNNIRGLTLEGHFTWLYPQSFLTGIMWLEIYIL